MVRLTPVLEALELDTPGLSAELSAPLGTAELTPVLKIEDISSVLDTAPLDTPEVGRELSTPLEIEVLAPVLEVAKLDRPELNDELSASLEIKELPEAEVCPELPDPSLAELALVLETAKLDAPELAELESPEAGLDEMPGLAPPLFVVEALLPVEEDGSELFATTVELWDAEIEAPDEDCELPTELVVTELPGELLAVLEVLADVEATPELESAPELDELPEMTVGRFEALESPADPLELSMLLLAEADELAAELLSDDTKPDDEASELAMSEDEAEFPAVEEREVAEIVEDDESDPGAGATVGPGWPEFDVKMLPLLLLAFELTEDDLLRDADGDEAPEEVALDEGVTSVENWGAAELEAAPEAELENAPVIELDAAPEAELDTATGTELDRTPVADEEEPPETPLEIGLELRLLSRSVSEAEDLDVEAKDDREELWEDRSVPGVEPLESPEEAVVVMLLLLLLLLLTGSEGPMDGPLSPVFVVEAVADAPSPDELELLVLETPDDPDTKVGSMEPLVIPEALEMPDGPVGIVEPLLPPEDCELELLMLEEPEDPGTKFGSMELLEKLDELEVNTGPVGMVGPPWPLLEKELDALLLEKPEEPEEVLIGPVEMAGLPLSLLLPDCAPEL
ncbi:hypothetical protein MN608_07393 [Microdochium nivale]|nr:hypothetical protein MN608_07393 [Microdochium nivale]